MWILQHECSLLSANSLNNAWLQGETGGVFLLQIIAAARCKISKSAFLLGLLRGKRWDEKEHKLFCSPEETEIPQEAQDLISSYKSSMKRSTTARFVHLLLDLV